VITKFKIFENKIKLDVSDLKGYGKIITNQLPSEGYYDFDYEFPYPISYEEPDSYIFMFFYDLHTDEKIIQNVENFFKEQNMEYEVGYALHKNVSYLMGPWFSSHQARQIQKDKKQIVFKIEISVDRINKELQLHRDAKKYNL
jgi:hypothetical protein